MRKLALLAPLFLILIGAAPAPASAPLPLPLTDAENRMRGHVEFLASDLLEGRETGTRGHEIAAAYVAAEFQKLGLAPAGENGSWYQQVPFRRATHQGTPSVSYSVAGSAATSLRPGTDFGLSPSLADASRSIEAPLVFAGHGIQAPRFGIDDYSGLDARGKIVVVLDGLPKSLPNDVSAHLRSVKDELAASHGAIGLIVVNSRAPEHSTAVGKGSRPVVGWVAPDGRSSSGPLKVDLALSEEWSRKLFTGAARELEAVRVEARHGSVRGFPLPGRMKIDSRSEWQSFTSPNVVARLQGGDPALAAEHIVLMGHLDHLGIDPNAAPGTDRIRNGALDNASGIATMLEAARSFATAERRPRRSILFLANTAEEMGLFGAGYFAARPTVPIDRLVGLVNLDMPLLTYDFTDVIAFGAEHSTIAGTAASAAKSMGVTLSPDPMPEQSLFVRSDHYPMVKQGVPSVFLMTGYANGGKKAWSNFFQTGYHRPTDDLSQPIHWQAAARFAELNFRIARALADAPRRPLWYRDSFFGDVFAANQPKAAGGPNLISRP